MDYSIDLPVRFGDTDPAGIVYYPNYFHCYHVAFETFFAASHGLPYSAWLSERGIGFPTVKIAAEFQAPFRYGETMRIRLTIPRLSRRSLDFRFRVFSSETEELRSESVITKVCMAMDRRISTEIPDDLRAIFEKYSGA